jgi:uncharacterized membrane protein
MDSFGSAFLGPRGPGADASPSEQLAAGIAQLLFPAVLFCLVAFAGLGHHETAVWVLMMLLSLAGYVIARVLSQRISFALWMAILGTVWNFVGAGAGFLLGGLIDFYGNF